MKKRIKNIINFDAAKYAKYEEDKESFIQDIESSPTLVQLHKRLDKLDIFRKIVRALCTIFILAWCSFLITSIFDVHEYNGKISLSIALIGLGFSLILTKLQHKYFEAKCDFMSALHKETSGYRFYECFHNNEMVVCYVTSAKNDSCDVQVLAESENADIIEQSFTFSLAPSGEVSEITLDFENEQILYPPNLKIIDDEE